MQNHERESAFLYFQRESNFQELSGVDIGLLLRWDSAVNMWSFLY